MASKDKQIAYEFKKEDFKNYLDSSGVSDQIAKILIALYEEPNKPENKDEFISRFLQKNEDLETVYLKNEVLRLREELSIKDNQINKLQQEIKKLNENINED